MKAAGTKATYSEQALNALRSSLKERIDQEQDAGKLVQCMEWLDERDMPCQFTEEEFDDEVKLSEASGFMSHEEVLKEFAQWGYVV